MGLYGTIEPQAPVASRERPVVGNAGQELARRLRHQHPVRATRTWVSGFGRAADWPISRLIVRRTPRLEVASVVASHDGDEYSLRQGNGIPWMK